MEKPPAASTSVPTSSLTAPNSRMQSNDLSFSDAEIVVPPPEPPARVMSNNVSIGGSKEARTSFTADSPYYTSYVEQEMRQLQVLSETLRDISARAKTFGKCGALMAEATRRLALSCRFKASTPGSADEDEETRQDREDKIAMERHEAVGDEMGTVLFTLGGVCSCSFLLIVCLFKQLKLTAPYISATAFYVTVRSLTRSPTPKCPCVSLLKRLYRSH